MQVLLQAGEGRSGSGKAGGDTDVWTNTPYWSASWNWRWRYLWCKYLTVELLFRDENLWAEMQGCVADFFCRKKKHIECCATSQCVMQNYGTIRLRNEPLQVPYCLFFGFSTGRLDCWQKKVAVRLSMLFDSFISYHCVVIFFFSSSWSFTKLTFELSTSCSFPYCPYTISI